MKEDTNSPMNTTIPELVVLVNQKTLQKLQKEIIARFEWTPNKKIRIVYANGVTEHYGCYYDCFETLNSKYRLNLESDRNSIKLQHHDNRGQSETNLHKKQNSHIKKIIYHFKKTLDKIERSKKTVHLNMAEIKQTIFIMKREILLCNLNDLLAALSYLYKREYLEDKDMFIYFEAIKKEIESFG